ncbi:MAG: hypothetical protein DDG60_05860 [Anaerolineae bacterium]|nr:MAG: hypothetical protein DDG60_05860 [Anaerolineae bacterium]
MRSERLTKTRSRKRKAAHQHRNTNPTPTSDNFLLPRTIELDFHAGPNETDPHPDAKQRQEAKENNQGLNQSRNGHDWAEREGMSRISLA